MKVSRSLKLMRGAGLRTRKLARDMLVFWKRVDKEMVIFFSSETSTSIYFKQFSFHLSGNWGMGRKKSLLLKGGIDRVQEKTW